MHFSFFVACLSSAVHSLVSSHSTMSSILSGSVWSSSCKSSICNGTSIDFNLLMVMCLLTICSFSTDRRNSTAVWSERSGLTGKNLMIAKTFTKH